MLIENQIAPQAMTFNAVHPEYAAFTPEEIKRKAYDKLQKYITDGAASARRTLEGIFTETPVDLYAPAERVQVDYDEGAKLFRALIKDRPAALPLGQHALDQLASRVELNTRFLHDLQAKGEQWAQKLGADILNELLNHRPKGEKYLVRSVDGNARAVLSDAYKCIDSRPTAEALLEAVTHEGATIIDGTYSETRVSLKVVHATPIELYPGEWAILGFDYSNSDFGDGACNWQGFILRLLCINGATVISKLRRIHLGSRAKMEGGVVSERTRRLAAEHDASMARDAVRNLLSKDAIGKLVDDVRAAHAAKVEPGQIEGFLKTRVGKGEAEAIVQAFNTADIEQVPAGQNAWRLSNAISLLARNTENARRKMDLERFAGEALAIR